ncbi:MAG: polyprenyl synthetase family protein [Flavobacteriales bacterium]|nr:polyprenyl synthetase family protein [Flavobacteriales bacterium]MCW8914142.1 polyprenyl synthetase family protein [Flavobacteriales bacterium]MCW8937910.1 polyprenyl synthetase family protein [Flavobacteriales bacterium]MCW8967342.1 polyprenyl synthetase family protein [Flavobacteriales bacterium]MCW8990866.1 polyprenyl synthetase family protein [Flavobacteriales bacterium]
MDKLTNFIQIVEEAIEKNAYKKQPQSLYAPINYTLALGGKRIRPGLLLLANDLFNGKPEKAINAALAIEVFHNFTLVHDDIMDNAPIRRGKPTVFKKWDVNTAILSGDVMLVEAYQLLAACESSVLPELLKLFNKTAVEVCEGQQYDMLFEKAADVTIDNYLKMIELKTAVLLGASLKMGAIIAGASKSDAKHFYEFGKNIGVAFQLMDDILDVYGNPEKFGKQVGGDILANKKTYLLLKTMELANGALRKELEFCLNSKTLSPENKITRVKSIYNQLKIKEKSIDEMNHFYNTAIAHLDSIEAPKEKKAIFENFAKKLMHRES